MPDKWSDEELAQLRELAGEHSYLQIAEKMGRSREAVKIRLRQLRLCGVRSARWSEAEIAQLRELAASKTCTQAAIEMGRGRTTVHWKAWQLGIVFSRRPLKHMSSEPSKREWSAEEIGQLRELAGKMSAAEIGRQIGRSIVAVRKMAQKLKISAQAPRSPRVARPKKVPAVQPVRISETQRIPNTRGAIEPGTIVVPRVVYCPVCSAPVVGTVQGWAAHYERVGCNRVAKRA